MTETPRTPPSSPTPTRSAPSSFSSSPILPPVAERRFGHRVRDIHSDHFDDGWDWLRDDTNPDVLAHLDAENTWADEACRPTSTLAQQITQDVKAHTALNDVSVPVLDGTFWYFRRWHEGNSYATHHRVPAPATALGPHELPPVPELHTPLPGEELLLDENTEAEGHEFFRAADLIPSPDGRLLAWARDLSGDERHQWIIRDIASGHTIDQAVTDAGYGFAWAADSSSFLYTGLDEAWRSCEIWHHRIGTPADEDQLLLVEDDEHFELGILDSADPHLTIIASTSTHSGRAWAWSPHFPSSRPLPLIDAQPNMQVTVESAGDHLLLVHTATCPEGSLAAAPMPTDLDEQFAAATVGPEFSRSRLPERQAGEPLPELDRLGRHAPLKPLTPPDTWIPLREAADGERLLDIEAFAHYAILSMRSNALTHVEYRSRRHPVATHPHSRPRPLSAEEIAQLWEPGHLVHSEREIRTLQSAPGARFQDRFFRVTCQSFIQPPRTLQIDPATGHTLLLKEQEAPGWDPSAFVEKRVWVTGRDGQTRIPVTLIHRSDLTPDGENPGWQIGYGSYEVSYDPEFETLRLPLLERGVVVAIAHIRGGGELGRAWYEDGKMLVKKHSFEDFVDVGSWLLDSGWVAPARLVAEGRSAGGLLMGAVLNMAPSLFRVILAGVPFVDALTTILDPSLPLTVGEWEEWGNPIEDPEIFAAMRAYTPYENVPEGVQLPAVMATSSLNDTRVEFVEPTKWVQRLREASGTAHDPVRARERPIVLRTQMVAGHAGPSGREGRWAARAEEFAFALGQVGITQ